MPPARRTHTLPGALGRAIALASALALAVVSAEVAVRPPAAAAATARTWVITLQDGASIDAVAALTGAAVRQRYTQAFTGFSAPLTDAQVTRLEADNRVRSVQEDAVVSHLETSPPDGTAPSEQFVPEGVRRVGGLQSPTARIDGVDTRVDADIAVLDTGVDHTHPDLYVPYRKDCVNDGFTGDPIGHGTEVAGVAAALDNRAGVVGVAPGARIWSVRVFAADESLTLESLLCGLDYVRANASRIDTAVMSFENEGSPDGICGVVPRRPGSPPGGHRKYEVLDPVDLAICRGTAAGVFFVAAAGNDSADAANTVPASYPEVYAVSAFTDTDGRPGGRGPSPLCFPEERDDTFAGYSNYGRTVDLSAPGTCAVTTFPGNSYVVDVGTSFSAPLVAGGAALLKARNPRANPLTLAATLEANEEKTLLPGDPDGIAEGVLNVSRF